MAQDRREGFGSRAVSGQRPLALRPRLAAGVLWSFSSPEQLTASRRSV